MIADGGYALHPPTGIDPAGMEKQGVLHGRVPQIMSSDMGDGLCRLPMAAGAGNGRKAFRAHEGKLAGLKHNAADGRGEAARAGAVKNGLCHGKLAIQAFTLGFKINGRGQAFGIPISRVGASMKRNKTREGLRLRRRAIIRGRNLCVG